MGLKHLLLEEDQGIMTIKINRPDKLNALNTEVLEELEQVLQQLEENSRIQVIIISGIGDKAFIAGADIAEMQQMDPAAAREFAFTGHRVFRLIEKHSRPIIAAINGFAIGGGNELALACDIRLAVETARFSQPEVSLGIIAGFGGTQRLAKIVGAGKAKQLLFTGAMIDAQEAYRIGLVNEITSAESLLERARDMALKIAKNAPLAVRMTKEAVNFGLEEDIEQGLAFESNLFALCFSTEDQKRGMSAFLNKEKAEFRGK